MVAASGSARAEAGKPRLGESHASLNERVRDAIKQAIIAGEYKPGDRLVEGRLADRFGVSRNPVREALKTLDTEGIVEIIPRRGAFVTALDDDEVREIVELRAVLEGIGARFASQRLSPAAVEALPEILKQGEEALANRDLAALTALNDKFHNALAEASSNRFLTDFIGTLRGKTHWLFAGISQERALRSWGEHAAIMRAVIDGDADMAELLASRHVSNVGRDLLSGELSSDVIPEEDEDN
ncbi:GntR family transcriptional regulator [Oceanibium sediminis]|uniref:GntR family transcriptional regulator n=1 Tax=Oceanibium sediminis TaxID=2026339 RepID=UPI000DD2EDB3|nr:GntR family transcriptional regulator [Oceanibium sediminis]